MIKVTNVQYKMGNSSNKTPVKPTNPTDHRSSFTFISECVGNAFSNPIKSSTTSSSSPLKGGSSSGDPGDSCSGPKSSSLVPSDKDTIKRENSPELENSVFQYDTESSTTSSDRGKLFLREGSEERANDEENVLNQVNPIVKNHKLDDWYNHQQPSTSKAPTPVIHILPPVNPVTGFGYSPRGEEDDEEETFSEYEDDDEYYESYFDFDSYANNVLLSDQNPRLHLGHNFGPSVMPNLNSEKMFNSRVDDAVATTAYDDDDVDDDNCYGNLSQLFSHLVGSHIRSKPRHPNYDDLDTDSDYDDPNGKNKFSPMMAPPMMPKEDQGELGIPRTQRLNKDGDPVIEKCKCHHHQVVSTK